ncbi:uncharacterized protein LOC141639331 [Silene latifolia]|uniref:uncharacterized protein LOC141639331 n=1 Tax=Silene latifolia TaxID=37657 RepID=UPI003D770374
MSKKIVETHNKSGTSYHASLDHCLYVPGLGHVAPDTYSGYGSLLESGVDDENEPTSAFNADVDTFVPDSVIEDVPDYVQKLDDLAACDKKKGLFMESGRSGHLSPKSMKFNRFCERAFEKQRKKEEQRGLAVILVDDVVEEKVISEESRRTADLSPKSKKFKIFCDKYLHKGEKLD